MSGKSLFEKLWDAHVVSQPDDSSALLYIDRIFIHERTGSVALQSLRENKRVVRRPGQAFGTMDHIIDTRPGRTDNTEMPSGKEFITAMRDGCAWAGIKLFDINDAHQGIVHVISPEQGIVLPGLTLVCPDSHTCSQGAFGALAWGIGSTEAEHALATTTLKVNKPKLMRVTLKGRMPEALTAKDIILHLIGLIGAAGATGHAVEFCGPVIDAMDMEARMTLCNMAVELSAFTAVIAPDDKAVHYLEGKPYAPRGAMWTQAVQDWKNLYSDIDAVFDRDISVDVSALTEVVTWGTSPEHVVPVDGSVPDLRGVDDAARRASARKAYDYIGLEPGHRLHGTVIDGVFIGSCTNGRLSDLRRAASVLQGRRITGGIKAICVPGSMQVKAAAEAEGLDTIFKDAGFEWRLPGCSMCFFAGGESFGEQERVVSTTNRNFENRQGSKTRTHLASPATAAASAIAGYITSPALLDRPVVSKKAES